MDHINHFFTNINVNTTSLLHQARQWQSWHASTWHEINEVVQIDGSNNFSLYELLTHALGLTKNALHAWGKFLFPIFVFLFKVVLHLFFTLVELFKHLYKMALPYMRRAYDRGSLAWESLSERTKMLIILSITAAILLILISRWILSLPFIKNIVTSWNNFKSNLYQKYQNFITNLQQKSLLLAQTIPHLLFISIIILIRWFDLNLEYFVSLSTDLVPLQSGKTGQVQLVEPIGKYILLPFAIIFPIIASLYHAITSEYFLSDKWIEYSMPKLQDNWTGKNERRFKNFYWIQYLMHFSSLFVDSTSTESTKSTKSNNKNAKLSQQSTVSSIISLINNTFLTTLSQSVVNYSNYWITLGLFFTTWSLPISGHVIDMVFQRGHYLPSALLIWMLNPFTKGGNSVVTFLRPLMKLIQYVPVLNLLISAPELQLPDGTRSLNITSPALPGAANNNNINNNNNNQENNKENNKENSTTSPTFNNHSLFRWIQMILDLPVVPNFVKTSILQALHESGLLLFVCSVGVFTPSFITEILTLIVCFVRPALASLGHSSNLRSLLAFQTAQRGLIENALDNIDETKGVGVGDVDGDKNNNNNNKTDKNSPPVTPSINNKINPNIITLDQALELRQQQLNTLKRLGIYLLLFSLNFSIRSLSRFISLSSIPLGSQMLLGALLYLQTPFFPISLFQAAIEPIIRRTFLSFHFNSQNVSSPQSFLLQNDRSSWDKLFAPSLITPNNHNNVLSNSHKNNNNNNNNNGNVVTINDNNYNNNKSGAFFTKTPENKNTNNQQQSATKPTIPTDTITLQNHIHFTSLGFQSGVASTIVTAKNFTISPIVAAMCLSGRRGRNVLHSDSDDDSDDDDDNNNNNNNDQELLQHNQSNSTIQSNPPNNQSDNVQSIQTTKTPIPPTPTVKTNNDSDNSTTTTTTTTTDQQQGSQNGGNQSDPVDDVKDPRDLLSPVSN